MHVVQEGPVLPEIAPYVKIKFPTADDSRGLGTGEFDETLGVDLSKALFDKLSAKPGVVPRSTSRTAIRRRQ